MTDDIRKNTQQDSIPEPRRTRRNQRFRFGGALTHPVQEIDPGAEEEIVDQDPGERQRRNQGDIEEDKLAS